ncbi:hypothetical protein FB451DRAFT_1317204 [Mycena latifolia]|nr:hypothetical protein FB451DRAFT_1317204 [Mycena latifolia]
MPTREQSMTIAAISAVRQPGYEVVFPEVLLSTWDSLRSPVAAVREGYRVLGRGSIKYAFVLAFSAVCKPLEDGCAPVLFGTLENALLREEMFVEILKKPNHPGVQRITTLDENHQTVSGGLFIFVGGLWRDALGLATITDWIQVIFTPLIRAALAAYNSWRPAKKAKKEEPARGTGCKRDLCILDRLRNLQIAMTTKKSTENAEQLNSLFPTLSLSPSPPTVTEDEEQLRTASTPGPSQSTLTASAGIPGAAFPTVRGASPTVLPSPQTLQAPISLKRKSFEDNPSLEELRPAGRPSEATTP